MHVGYTRAGTPSFLCELRTHTAESKDLASRLHVFAVDFKRRVTRSKVAMVRAPHRHVDHPALAELQGGFSFPRIDERHINHRPLAVLSNPPASQPFADDPYPAIKSDSC